MSFDEHVRRTPEPVIPTDIQDACDDLEDITGELYAAFDALSPAERRKARQVKFQQSELITAYRRLHSSAGERRAWRRRQEKQR